MECSPPRHGETIKSPARKRLARYCAMALVVIVSGCGSADSVVITAEPGVAEAYPFGKPAYCKEAVAGNLVKYGVMADEVKSISYSQITRPSSFGSFGGSRESEPVLVGWQTWVRLKDRDGAMIIHVEKDTCFTGQVYTRAGLSIPGLKQF